MTKRGRSWRVARVAKARGRVRPAPIPPIDTLPDELLTHVFMFLDPFSYFRCRRVCKRFQGIVLDNIDRYMISLPPHHGTRFDVQQYEYLYINQRIRNVSPRYNMPQLHYFSYQRGIEFDYSPVHTRFDDIAAFRVYYYSNLDSRLCTETKVIVHADPELKRFYMQCSAKRLGFDCGFAFLEFDKNTGFKYYELIPTVISMFGREMITAISLRFRQFFELIVLAAQRIEGAHPAWARPKWASGWKWPLFHGLPRGFTWIETGIRFLAFCHKANSPVRALLWPQPALRPYTN